MYNDLFMAWRREIDDPSLGGLPSDFYVKIEKYMVQIEEENKALEKRTVKVNLLEQEAHNVELMLKELLDLRYKKILKTITRLHKAPIELLTDEEAKMCESLVGFSNLYHEFAKNLIEGKQTQINVGLIQPSVVPAIETPRTEIKPKLHVNHKRLTLRFIKNIPAIMGADMKSYGPFNAEDVASLPSLNAQILIKQGLAVLVEVS